MTPRVSRNEHHSASSHLSLSGERCKPTLNSAHRENRSESSLRQTNRGSSCLFLKGRMSTLVQRRVRSDSSLRQTNRTSPKGGSLKLARSSQPGAMMHLGQTPANDSLRLPLHHFTKAIPMGFVLAMFFLSQVGHAATNDGAVSSFDVDVNENGSLRQRTFGKKDGYFFLKDPKGEHQLTGMCGSVKCRTTIYTPSQDAAFPSPAITFEKRINVPEEDEEDIIVPTTLYLLEIHNRNRINQNEQVVYLDVRIPLDGQELFGEFLRLSEQKTIASMKNEYLVRTEDNVDRTLTYDSFRKNREQGGWMVVYNYVVRIQSETPVDPDADVIEVLTAHTIRLGFSPQSTHKLNRRGKSLCDVGNTKIWCSTTDTIEDATEIKFGHNTRDVYSADLAYSSNRGRSGGAQVIGAFIDFVQNLTRRRRRLQTTRVARRLLESERAGHSL